MKLFLSLLSALFLLSMSFLNTCHSLNLPIRRLTHRRSSLSIRHSFSIKEKHVFRINASQKPIFRSELDSKYFEFQRLEEEIYTWWESSGFFKPIEDKNAKKYVIPMPPPNVTGYLHMGHAIFVALQDIMARYYRMKGYASLWVPGTDHAGIATQLLVERQLSSEGISRASLGRDPFLSRVWQWKEEKGGYITQQMRRLGASADWSREKFTLDPDMNEAVTEAFIRLYEKGLVYRGNYMVNWSPNLQTAVSDLEVEYSEEEGKLYFFKYQLADGTDFIPVATTRPETILGDSAVCVHPEDPRYAHMIGKKVIVPMLGREIPVIADEYVDREFGTGALKITPAHDINDYELGKKHNLAMINIMNKDATINSLGGERYTGLDRFECRKKLWSDMKDQGLVIKEEKHMQRVPRSQRGGEIIEPMISPQWFVKMDSMAAKAVDAVRTGELRIIPDRFEKTWYNWLENIHDWCISRQLWWGHRIPVYYVRSATTAQVSKQSPSGINNDLQFVVAKSMEEARSKAELKYGKDIVLEQDEDVLDTWFSSGLWPFATVGWPHAEKDPNSDYNRFYPASVLETGYDILFFWVARMVTMGIELTGKVPFSVIYMHGLVRDAQGQKMSKTKGNVIDPLDTIAQYGSDALRYSLVTGSTPGQDIPLSIERIEGNRNFVNKLWNAGKYIQNCLTTLEKENGIAADEFAVRGTMTPEEISSLLLPERFIVSRCHILVGKVTKHLEEYDFGEAGRIIYDFLWDDLADWYIEMSKPHMRSDDPAVRRSTVRVLVYVWDIALRLLHPFMPYVTETIWQSLPHIEESLIIANWPDFQRNQDLVVDEGSIKALMRIQSLTRAVRNARSEYNVDAGKKVPIIIRASDEFSAALRAESKAFATMARVDEAMLEFVTWSAGVESAKQSGPYVHLIVEEDIEAYLPQSGLLDKEKELQRLGKQAEKLRKDIGVLEGRLANKAFSEKAPAHLVQEVQGKLTDLKQQLATVDKSMQSLSADK